jgi:hypothetical protein
MLVASNRALTPLLVGADPALLRAPLNVLRLSLHPSGLAPRIANLGQWRSHLLARLRHQIEVTADPFLTELLHELSGYPAPGPSAPDPYAGIAVPLRLVTGSGTLSFISTTTVFGTSVDVTLSEIALETFFPADPETAAALVRLAEGRSSA